MDFVQRLAHVRDRRPGGEPLYYFEFTPDLHDRCKAAFGENFQRDFGFFGRHHMGPVRRPDAPVYDYAPYFVGEPMKPGSTISDDGVLSVPGSAHHFTHWVSPLRDVFDEDALRAFPVWRTPEHFTTDNFAASVAAAHAAGEVATLWIGRMFEAAWPIRGYENFLADMAAEPEIAEYFLDNELRWNLWLTQQAVTAGVDMIITGDDVGSQKGLTMSPETWRALIKPRWKAIYALAKSINPKVTIWYHSCGNILPIIPDLIEIGLDILNPIQPECMDIDWIWREYHRDLSFDGGLGTQQLMPHGTPAQVRDEVRRLMDQFGANGGYILSPAHVLEPEVPLDNILAAMETARDY